MQLSRTQCGLTPLDDGLSGRRLHMKATFSFSLPDDQGDFDAARLGRSALAALWQIDQHCRSLLKDGEPTPKEAQMAEKIRAMIPAELLEV